MPRISAFATLERLRQHAENAAERTLGQAEAAVSRGLLALQAVEADMQRLSAEARVQTPQAQPALVFQVRQAQRKALQEQRSQVLRELHEFEAQREDARQLYLQARVSREAISELLASEQLRLRAEALRQEQKLLDDLFAMRHSRRGTRQEMPGT